MRMKVVVSKIAVSQFNLRKVFLLCSVIITGLLLFKATPVFAIAGSWSANGSTIYYSDGNVGLGTSSPLGLLHLTANTPWNSGNGFRMQSANGSDYTLLYASTDGANQVSALQSYKIGTSAGTKPLLLNPQGGKVGIATSNPLGSLHVTSDAVWNDGSGFRVQGSNPADYTLFYVSTDNGLQASALQSYKMGTNAGVRSILLNPQGGNVGIGTTNPTYTLSVNGKIRAKEIVVDTSWADYVFDKGYKLMPLNELEKYIQNNDHLPGILTANTIETNGASLGEMQKQQMAKIEELTLYTIQLNKENLSLKSELNSLEQRLNKLESKF
jgi:hypothetical protein